MGRLSYLSRDQPALSSRVRLGDDGETAKDVSSWSWRRGSIHFCKAVETFVERSISDGLTPHIANKTKVVRDTLTSLRGFEWLRDSAEDAEKMRDD